MACNCSAIVAGADQCELGGRWRNLELCRPSPLPRSQENIHGCAREQTRPEDGDAAARANHRSDAKPD